MKTNLILSAALFFAGSLISVQADDKEDLTGAIKKLAEKGNYSWTSTTKRPERTGGDTGGRGGRGASGPTEGKTADGLAYVTSKRGDRTSESLVKGKKSAYKGQDGWAAVEEQGAGGQGQRRGRGGRGLRNFKAPAVQAEELLGNVSELKKDGDAYTGALKEEAAKAMVSFGGGRGRGGDAGGGDRPQPTGVKVTAKFWIKDGVLTKYETVAAGSISFNGNDRDLGRTTTVEINEVGTTKINVPNEAKKLVSE
jgi:hypothetical protein